MNVTALWGSCVGPIVMGWVMAPKYIPSQSELVNVNLYLLKELTMWIKFGSRSWGVSGWPDVNTQIHYQQDENRVRWRADKESKNDLPHGGGIDLAPSCVKENWILCKPASGTSAAFMILTRGNDFRHLTRYYEYKLLLKAAVVANLQH